MTEVFADTSFYLALLCKRDGLHGRAVVLSNELSGPTVTTSWVLTELGNALAGAPQRPGFTRFFSVLKNDSRCEILPASEKQFESGVELYQRRSDKNWSLTDCISFVVMRERGITEALTADHHFQQAGFMALLR